MNDDVVTGKLGVDVVVGGSAVVVVPAGFGAIVGSVIACTTKADVNTIMMSNAIVVLTKCRVSNISVRHLKYNGDHLVFNLWYYSSKSASRKLCMSKNDLPILQVRVISRTLLVA
jgi:hypothetical protein